MASFYKSLKELFSQEMAKKTAQVLEEKEADIDKATSHIIAGLLGVIAKKGHTPQIRNIFEEAGNIDLISDIGLFDEYLTHPQQDIGDNFLEDLLNDKADEFTIPISEASGISEVATNRLISVIAPSFPAFFGQKMVKEGVSFQTIIDDIKAQENTYVAKIPSDLIKTFGLGTILSTSKVQSHTASNTINHSTASTKTTTPEPEPEKRNRNGWITWLFFMIALLLVFFLWRSCSNNTDNLSYYSSDLMADSVNVIAEANPTITNAPEEILDITEITLPNGEQLEGYKNGIEEEMVNFLNSEAYKNASAKDLENIWFEFDNLDFEFGSTTRLKEKSESQLENVIAILKAYKNAKVTVAAFADKEGTETANMKVSKERAQAIEKMLEAGGVGSQVIKAKGYGNVEEKRDADASDSDKAKDRDISLRFVK